MSLIFHFLNAYNLAGNFDLVILILVLLGRLMRVHTPFVYSPAPGCVDYAMALRSIPLLGAFNGLTHWYKCGVVCSIIIIMY